MKYAISFLLCLFCLFCCAAEETFYFFPPQKSGQCSSLLLVPDRFEQLPGIDTAARELLPVDVVRVRKELKKRGIDLDISSILMYDAGGKQILTVDGLNMDQLKYLIRNKIIASNWTMKDMPDGDLGIVTNSKRPPAELYAHKTKYGVALLENPAWLKVPGFPPKRVCIQQKEPVALYLYIRPEPDMVLHPALAGAEQMTLTMWRGTGNDQRPRLKALVQLDGKPTLYANLKGFIDAVLQAASQKGPLQPEHLEMFQIERGTAPGSAVIRVSLTEEMAAMFFVLFTQALVQGQMSF